MVKSEIDAISNFIDRHGLKNLSEIKKCALPERSTTLIYNIILEMNVPIDKPKLVKFFCCGCNMLLYAIHIYFGLTRKPICPNCKSKVKYINSRELRLIGDASSKFVLRGGKLFPPCERDLSILEGKFALHKGTYPIYYRNHEKKSDSLFHIVSRIQDRLVSSYCGKRFIKRTPFVSSSEMINRDSICRDCSMEANERQIRGLTLKPDVLPKNISKRAKMLRVVLFCLTLGNIKEACLKLGVSRTTYYNYLKQLDFSVNRSNLG